MLASLPLSSPHAPPPIRRTRHQPRSVRLPRLHRPPHLIIYLQNHPLRPILPEPLLILALHNRECLHNIIHIIALDTIQVKIRRIQLTAQQKTSLLIPTERRPIIATIFGEGFQVPGCVGEFECSRKYPITQRNVLSHLHVAVYWLGGSTGSCFRIKKLICVPPSFCRAT